MASEKKKVFEEIQENFKKDPVIGGKLRKDVPLLATNLQNPKHLEFIFNEYKKQGLIPEQFKSAEDLTGYLQRRLHAEMDGIIKSDASIKGDKKFKKAYFKKRTKEILKKVVQNEAVAKLTPDQKANPELMAQISKMKWTGLPIKVNSEGELSFARRYFHDKVSKRVIDYAEGIEPGLGKKWAKEMRASWTDIGKKNQALKASSGISMDIGHFVPSILDGPNVGTNAEMELSSMNRAKGGTPFTGDKNLARQLGIPESWMQSFTDWHLRQQGLDPNALPKGYELKGTQVVKAAEGISDPNAEIAKNRLKYELDQQPVPEGKLQPDFEVINGKVVKKLTQPTKTQEILNVIKQPVYESTVNGKKIKQTITAASKVIDRIPTKVKIGGAIGLGGMGFLGSGSAIAKSLLDGEESIEQQKANDLMAASGALQESSWIFPPMWAPATMMWGLAEMKQWQVDMKEQKAEDRELWYMQKYIQATDEEGMPTNATLGADTRRTGRFKR